MRSTKAINGTLELGISAHQHSIWRMALPTSNKCFSDFTCNIIIVNMLMCVLFTAFLDHAISNIYLPTAEWIIMIQYAQKHQHFEFNALRDIKEVKL